MYGLSHVVLITNAYCKIKLINLEFKPPTIENPLIDPLV